LPRMRGSEMRRFSPIYHLEFENPAVDAFILELEALFRAHNMMIAPVDPYVSLAVSDFNEKEFEKEYGDLPDATASGRVICQKIMDES